MKLFLSIIFTLLCGTTVHKEFLPVTYFISPTGSDSNNGTSSSTPWQTINKLNFSATYAPGVTVAFQCGGTYPGTITINQSGTQASPILVTSYGTGKKPVIGGLTTLSSWTSYGGGLYASALPAVKSYDPLLLINGIPQTLARWPNSGYELWQSTTNTTITDPVLTSRANLTGMQVCPRSAPYIIDNSLITSDASGVLTFTPGMSLNPAIGTGYFVFDGNPDTVGEWAVRSDTVLVFFGSGGPSGTVQTVTSDTLLYTNHSFITLDSLDFEGSNKSILLGNTGDSNISIIACDLRNAGNDAIQFNQAPHLTLLRDSIKNALNDGVLITGGNTKGVYVGYTDFYAMGSISGMGQPGDHAYEGINCTFDSTNIEYNTMRKVGFNGVFFSGIGSRVVHNYFDSCMLRKADGAAIYTWDASSISYANPRRVDTNTISNTYGDLNGTTGDTTENAGLYIDGRGSGIYASYNTIFNCDDGVFNHGNAVTVRNNNLYNHLFAQIFFSEVAGNVAITGSVVKNNTLATTTAGQRLSQYSTSANTTVSGFGVTDSNQFVVPIGSSSPFFTKTTSDGGTPRAIASWQSATGADAHSVVQIASTVLGSNPTAVPEMISLPTGSYRDVSGNAYSGTTTLSPFSSTTFLAQLTPPSESSDLITYDTVINIVNASNNGQGTGGLHWLVRITRPRNYFTLNNADTASRPMILTMPGAGEVQTGNASDTNFLTAWGPHFWQLNGYNMQIHLENGNHYPLWVTVVQAAQNTRPWFTLGLIRSLKSILHPKVIHVGGLSQGSYEWGCLIGYSNNTTGDHEAMGDIKSWVDLEGVGPETFQNSGTPTDATMPASFGTWALPPYNGRFFGLEGTADTRNVWQISQPMNTALANTGYFSYQDNDGGAHGGWNQLYDPSQLNWLNFAPITNPYLVNPGSPSSSIGSYFYDPSTGTNVFQWMLRQGDTTLVGGCSPIANAGGNQSFYLPQTSCTTIGTASAQCGGSLSSILWTQISGATATISNPTALTTNFTGLNTGVYVFQLAVTDNTGAGATSTISITVNAEIPPTVSAGGTYVTTLPSNAVTLSGSASGNGGASVSRTTWSYVSGPTGYNLVSPNNLSTTLAGLVAGTYIFQLTATDNNGNSASSNATINVFTVAASGPPTLVGPGEYQCAFLNNELVYTVSTNLNNTGTGGAGSPGVTGRIITSPSTLKFTTVASCLHGSAGVDTARYAWVWGDNSQGLGNGHTSQTVSILNPFRITTDSAGNTMQGVAQIVGYYAGNSSQGYYFIMTDGSLRIVGDTRCGMRGDGSPGLIDSFVVKIPTPGNRQVVQLIAGYHTIIRCSDGTVWTTGGGFSDGTPGPYSAIGYIATTSATDFRSWHQLTLPAGTTATQIAGGIYWDYAVLSNGKLYGWGLYGTYLGHNDAASGGGNPVTTPTELTQLEAVFAGRSILQIVTNSMASYALLSDSSVYAWGDNAMGNIGNGTELPYSNLSALTPSGSTVYSFNLGTPGVLLQISPVLISGTHHIAYLFGSSVFTFYLYMEDAQGNLYSWGRNKSAVLGNGIRDPNGGAFSALYPNSWDVTLPTLVNPLGLVVAFVSTSPWCTIGSNITTSPCNTYTRPGNQHPVANAGVGFSATIPAAVLNGTLSSDDVHITYYLWAFVNGPTTPTFDFTTSPTPIIGNLVQGVYNFSLMITDNDWQTSTATVQVTVLAQGIRIIVHYKGRHRKYFLR